MRVPWQHSVCLTPGQSIQRIGHLQRTACQVLNSITQIEPNRSQHLVIARAPQVYASAGSADPLGQAFFQRSLTILVFQADVPLAPGMLLAERSQPGSNLTQVLRRQQLLTVEHLHVGKGGSNVVADEPLIERIVLASRVPQHTAVERSTLVPQTAHQELADCCSAGLSALTSATINVPVPSFVNTS